MRKIAFALALAAITGLSQAQTPPPPVVGPQAKAPNPKVEARRAERAAAGTVSRRTDGATVRIFDLRGGKSADWAAVATKIQNFCSVAVDSVKSDKGKSSTSLDFGLDAVSDPAVGAAVVISCDGENRPALTVLPEDGVAVINADRLSTGLPAEKGEAVFNARLEKEIWRSVAFVAGGYVSDYPCVLKAVSKTSDLDAVAQMTCPPVNGKVAASAKVFGLAQVQTAPYGVAVAQGWAPAPTNDAQRAIWNRVKAGKSGNAPTATPPAK